MAKTNYNIYQAHLSEERVHMLNNHEKGWDAFDWSRAKAGLTTLFDDNPFKIIPAWMKAVETDLYRHTWIVTAYSLADLHITTNMGMREGKNIEYAAHIAVSGSIGDFVTYRDSDGTTVGYICCAYGWHKVPDEYTKHFESKVSQVMLVGEQVHSA